MLHHSNACVRLKGCRINRAGGVAVKVEDSNNVVGLLVDRHLEENPPRVLRSSNSAKMFSMQFRRLN